MFVRKYFVLLIILTCVLDSLALFSWCASLFGSPNTLEKICAKKGACVHQGTPVFLNNMFEHLMEPANIKPHMFQNDGDAASLAKLEKEMKKCKPIQLNKYGSLEIAAGIKRFLRNLKVPLINFELARTMSDWQVSNLENLKRNFNLMPKSHFAVICDLLKLLHYLTKHGEHKMKASELASALGVNLIPVVNLIKTSQQTEEDYKIILVMEKNKINACLTYLIDNYETFQSTLTPYKNT